MPTKNSRKSPQKRAEEAEKALASKSAELRVMKKFIREGWRPKE